MEPAIGRSIRQGFQAANRSWAGIGFLAASWIVVWLLAALLVVLTRIPRELLSPPQPTQAAPTTEQATTPDLGQTPEDQQARAERETAGRWVGTASEWFRRSWPLLALTILWLIAADLWLQGGLIGYLAKIVNDGKASVSEIWMTGTRAFGSLLSAWLISIAAVIILMLIGVLVVWLFSLASKAVPGWVLGIVGLLIGLAAVVALVWLGIKLAFWYLAIVVEKMGPVAALKASFRTTRGYWWKLSGVLALYILILVGVQMVVGFLDGLGNLAGGGVATAVGVITNVLGAVANLYLGFVFTAAYLRFYGDTKAEPVAGATMGTVTS